MEYSLVDFNLEHAYSISYYANNFKIAKNLRNTFPHPYFYEDACNFIESYKNTFTKAILINDEAVGSISIIQKDDVNFKVAEIGYWLGEPFWNHGIMTKVVCEMVDLAFKNLDIVKIYGEPFFDNIASCKVLKKAGFKREAVLKDNIFKNNEIKDSYIYSIFRDDLNE